MFEDSLVESQGRIRTRSRGFAIVSFTAQATLLLLLILLPFFHPEALPRQSLERLLVAPPPAASPAPVVSQQSPSSARRPMQSLQSLISAPRTIPNHIQSGASEQAPPSTASIGSSWGNPGDGVLGGLPVGTPTIVVAAQPRPAPRGPVTVSSGVAAGQLIGAIRPIYPRIAIEARIQGTVVVEATISRTGTIENLRVTEGPPMLRQAAIDAVSAARYRPYLLNGEPVEVQTSVRVVFSLGQ